jgi:hypothetical protein
VASFLTTFTDSTNVDYVIVGCYTPTSSLVIYKINPVSTNFAYNTFAIAGGLVPQFNPILGNKLFLAEPTSFPSQNLSFAIWSFDLSSTPVGNRIVSGLLPWPRGARGNNLTCGTLSSDRLLFSYYDSAHTNGLFVYNWPPTFHAEFEEQLQQPEEETKKEWIDDEFGGGEKAPMASYLTLLSIRTYSAPVTPYLVLGTGDVGFVMQLNPHSLSYITAEYDLNYWYGSATTIGPADVTQYYSSVFGGQQIASPCFYGAYFNGSDPSGFVINEYYAPYNRYARVQVMDTYVSETSFRAFAQKFSYMAYLKYSTLYIFSTSCS